ncbi:hypothetical protein BDV35DRAFT_217052 [Aspergillus flavus]|uniref:Uncharacterized protein n=3 Tax=Aspergillus subgen. Circumdati TaxID=2720871 RepID=A0A1S9DAW3_ASPOZ|nr:uncharacterized protein G4B84_007759 [Aspergillus flavus NRRL3357]KAB8246812.1 hypothetical protein BDV35DRAFT_217052 [Aspergillus flavus]OOO06231.1 hypothetical protein OAory_01018920 [Aspergillus oryzae]GMG43088.1 unnamed protein product [Aspergillus oryzae var. brunneus]QMW32328.1 hypothetical protein G4B84_007759 [Aspergillus flavus NRRL3357]QMW44358.1 hypothetical protein G4B11_007778 [Aspergillus flavus]
MLRFVLYSSLFAATLGYRLFEYTGERCTGSNVGLHRLAGPSGCAQLNDGVASSLLVKIDNVHDDLYQVNVYENEDCTGSIVGAIANTNGCLNLHVFNTVGKSVEVVSVSKKRNTSDIGGFETDSLYNLDEGIDGEIQVPIMHGGFSTAEKSYHSEDGTYLDEAFDLWIPHEVDRHSMIKDLWFHKLDEEGPSNYLNDTSLHVHDARQLEWAYCNFQAACMGAVNLGGRLTNAAYARGLMHYIGNLEWKDYLKAVNFIVGHTANGITIISSLHTAGSGSPEQKCETNKTTRELAGDLVNSIGKDDVTNIVWVIKDENGKEWELGLRARALGTSNNNNCGACALCL